MQAISFGAAQAKPLAPVQPVAPQFGRQAQSATPKAAAGPSFGLTPMLGRLWAKPPSWPAEIKDPAAFEAQVIQASFEKPVVALYYAEWSGPARFIRPHLAEVVRQDGLESSLSFVAVDLEALPALEKSQKVWVVPTLVVYRQGQAQSRITAYQGPDKIRAFLQTALSGPIDKKA